MLTKEANGKVEMDDSTGSQSVVARLLERLLSNSCTGHEREQALRQLLSVAKQGKDGRIAICSHAQAIPLLITTLKSGTVPLKISVASILGSLCKDEDLRIKVLLGGCIPPLLGLLRNGLVEAQKAAAEAIYAVSNGSPVDHVGSKIFMTESVIPCLWEQLRFNSHEKEVSGLLTGALRNLCNETDCFLEETLKAGGVEILVRLLLSGNVLAQANASFLLANLISSSDSCSNKVYDSGAIKFLLSLLSPGVDCFVRAEAAGAVRALTLKLHRAKKSLIDVGGIPILVKAISSSKNESEYGQSLRDNALGAVANIYNGMSKVVQKLGETIRNSGNVAYIQEVVGALGYALEAFDEPGTADSLNLVELEGLLVDMLKPSVSNIGKRNVVESLSSLYGNVHLQRKLHQSKAKGLLVGLITMADPEVQEELISSLKLLSVDNSDIWQSINGRHGVQLLISLLGLTTVPQQEYAVGLLSIISDNVDEGKWAITAAGGIPPLVQLLMSGSDRAKEGAAIVLKNLCSHSEDIRACVNSAEAVPALLHLLEKPNLKVQRIAAEALRYLLKDAKPFIFEKLRTMLLGEVPESKVCVLDVCSFFISLAPYEDLVCEGSAAQRCFKTILQMVSCFDQVGQENAISLLADVFDGRQDICKGFGGPEITVLLCTLLRKGTYRVAIQAARALSALYCSIDSNKHMSFVAKETIIPLFDFAKSSDITVAEIGIAALANLFLDKQVAEEALTDDIIPPMNKVLKEGSARGKFHAAAIVTRLLKHGLLDNSFVEKIQSRGTAISLVSMLSESNGEYEVIEEALEALSLLSKVKQEEFLPWISDSEESESLKPFMISLTCGMPSIQEKAIKVLSRLCRNLPGVLGNMLAERSDSLNALGSCVIHSSSLEAKVGATSLLICVIKEHRERTLEVLDDTGFLDHVIKIQIEMIKNSLRDSVSETVGLEVFKGNTSTVKEQQTFIDTYSPSFIGGTVAMWFLCLVASADRKYKIKVQKAGAIEILANKIASTPKAANEENWDAWVASLFLAISFQDKVVVEESATRTLIQSLALLCRSDNTFERYFAAEALASLVRNGSKDTIITVANTGVCGDLISNLGNVGPEMVNIAMLSEEFLLVQNPDQDLLEQFFQVEEIRVGAIARRQIPTLVDLLKPMADRQGSPLLALRILIRIAESNNGNKIAMAEAGALESVTKYLSLGPQGQTEEASTELLLILFENYEVRQHECVMSALNQLIAVTQLGSRSARYNAMRALGRLFEVDKVRCSDVSKKAIKPLLETLAAGSEMEQTAAITGLIKLSFKNIPKANAIAEADGNPIENLHRILTSHCSIQLKECATHLCCILFEIPRARTVPDASLCIRPLIEILSEESFSLQEAGVCALANLFGDEEHASTAVASGVIVPLVQLIIDANDTLLESVLTSLIRLSKHTPDFKSEMVNAGVLENALSILTYIPDSLCTLIAELFCALTDKGSIARGAGASKLVEPMLIALSRPELGAWGQQNILKTILNILKRRKNLSEFKLSSSQVIEPLLALLDSSSQVVQQLGAELLALLFGDGYFQQDALTQKAVVPLVQLVGISIPTLQEKAIKALVSVSLSWPNAVAEAGAIAELSKIVMQSDPKPTQQLWEAAGMVISNILRFSSQYSFKMSLRVLVKLLRSNSEKTVETALSALVHLEKDDASCGEKMADAGAIKALLELLKCHQCEEVAAKLLEALFNNGKVRDMKVVKHAIAPLSEYLLDAQTRAQPARLLVALALGDLFQQDGLARTTDSSSACRALVSVLEDEPTEDMQIVALCALQNLVANSRTNRRAVAEAGGIQVVQEFLASANSEISGQAALLMKQLFSSHVLKEYVSIDLINSLTAALDRDLWAKGSVNEDVVKAINVIFSNFSKFRGSDVATVCIQHLNGALRAGSEAAQEAALDALCLLKHSWASIPADVGRAQALAAAESIPILQLLVQSGPARFHEKAESLLQCLPGTLIVIIKKGNNLKQTLGNTNAFCKLSFGNGPPRETKVINQNTSPEWKQEFAWAFDVPPKGQKLNIACKSKNAFGKSLLGKVTIQIDKVVVLGTITGQYTLTPESNRDGTARTLEIEFQWSNR